MNQREFDEDLKVGSSEDWENEEDGRGWTNNPIRRLFENPKQMSEKSFLEYPDYDED